ncbi:lipopolysaccharide biosynthesis protein [Candidatus Marinimicrobia bacterium]|nr:lipopolysaccharide biosynthesis protein [Candidatus Neomarinimicrobiota bacterium]
MWSGIERFSAQLLQFIFTIYLARILLPSDFGLIGMLSIFIGLSEIISDGGFFRALVQKSNVNNHEYSSVFWINSIISLIVFSLLWILSPYISSFYNEPILEKILQVLSFNVIIKSLSIVQKAKLTISLNFKALNFISIISISVSGLVGVYFALKGHGIWALVYQITLRNLIFLLVANIWIKWLPSLVIDMRSISNLFKFGSNLLIIGIIDVLFLNMYNVFIGKYYSKNDLGFYSRAQQMNDLVAINFTSVIQRVAFTSMSKIKNNDQQMISQYRSYLRMGNFLIAPIALFICILSEPIVLILFSEKWIESARYLQLMSIIGLFYFISSISLTFLNAKGLSKEFLKIEVIKKFLIMIVLIFTFKHGIETIIIGQIFVGLISLYLNTIYNYKFTSYTFYNLLKDIFPPIILAFISASFVYIATLYIDNNFLEIFFGALIGLVSYIVLAFCFKLNEIKNIKSYINGLKNE